MKINFQEFKWTIKLTERKESPDLLAYASLNLIEEHGRHLTINGFTIRKSKFNNKPYLADPSKRTQKGFFKFVLFRGSLRKEFAEEAVEAYENETIPIIEE